MDLSQLEYFRTIARLGNMSEASKEFFVSQPGLSRSLTRLEEEIGVPLFERRKGRVKLNDYGQLFLTSVNESLSCLDCGIEKVKQMYSRDQSILSLACPIDQFLSDYLNMFFPRHPEIAVRHFNYSINEIENQLLHQKLDIAFCCQPIPNSRICFEQLIYCPYVLAFSSENPLSKESRIDLIRAKDEPFICSKPHLNRMELTEVCQNCGFIPYISHEVDSMDMLANLLYTNTGVVLVPVAHFIKTSTRFPECHITALMLNDKLPIAPLGAVYLQDQKLSLATTKFLEFARQQAKKEQEEINEFIRQYPFG